MVIKIRRECAGIALLCMALLGCDSPPQPVGMAEQAADQYYQALKSKDFDKAASYFLDTPGEPTDKWLQQLRDYNGKLGDLQGYHLVDKAVNTVYSGTRYTLIFNTKYSKYSATETLSFFDGIAAYGKKGGNGMKIEGMSIESKGIN